MKQLILSLLMIAGWASARAQVSDYNVWSTGPDDTLKVYAEKAYIRSEPSVQGTIADTLYTGDEVIMVKDTTGKSLTMKGVSAPWTQVRYKGKLGYVWLGLLAVGHYEKDNVSFLYGIEKTWKVEFGCKYLVRLKAVGDNHKVLDMKEWTVGGGEYANSSMGKVMGNMGLDSITTVVRIFFSGDACAIPTDYYYFGWNGRELLPLPGRTSVSDAGAYNSQETLLFPSEIGGQPHKIIRMGLVETFGEDMETVEKRTTSREEYSWDGRKATLIKK